jgi:hypothetical protein
MYLGGKIAQVVTSPKRFGLIVASPNTKPASHLGFAQETPILTVRVIAQIISQPDELAE